MADEGSVSAALMEIEDARDRKHLLSAQRRHALQRRDGRSRAFTWRTAAIAAAGVFGFIAATWWLKRNA